MHGPPVGSLLFVHIVLLCQLHFVVLPWNVDFRGKEGALLREGALFIHNVNRFSKCCLNAHRLLEVCCLRLKVFLSLFAYVFVIELTKK